MKQLFMASAVLALVAAQSTNAHQITLLEADGCVFDDPCVVDLYQDGAFYFRPLAQ